MPDSAHSAVQCTASCAQPNTVSSESRRALCPTLKRHAPLLEPEEPEHASDAEALLEHGGDGDAGVQQLLAALVADGRHEARGLPDEPQLARPVVVHRHGRGRHLHLGYDDALLHQLDVHAPEAREVYEGSRLLGV